MVESYHILSGREYSFTIQQLRMAKLHNISFPLPRFEKDLATFLTNRATTYELLHSYSDNINNSSQHSENINNLIVYILEYSFQVLKQGTKANVTKP